MTANPAFNGTTVSWSRSGPMGRRAADVQETQRICELVEAGHLLANEAKNPRPATIQEILDHLGVITT